MTDETNSRKARAKVAVGALEGLVRCAEDLAGKAQQLAPVDEGTLRGSASITLLVNGTRFDGSGAKAAAESAVRAAALAGRPITLDAEVSFNTVYAARQHEELDWEHPRGGQAKYLEGPLLSGSARYSRIIALAAQNGTN